MVEDRDISEIFALPLRIVRTGGGYCVEDADKQVLAYHYAPDDNHIISRMLDWKDAELIAKAVARALTNQASR